MSAISVEAALTMRVRRLDFSRATLMLVAFL